MKNALPAVASRRQQENIDVNYPVWSTACLLHVCDKMLTGDMRLQMMMMILLLSFSVFCLKTEVRLNEEDLCVSIATPYRLGFGRVLPPIPGVQRQSGVTILQRPRAPGGLPGNTHTHTPAHIFNTLQRCFTFCITVTFMHRKTKTDMYTFKLLPVARSWANVAVG